MEKYSKTLVVDNTYTARSIITTIRAFSILYKGNAELVENHPITFGVVDPDLIIYKPSVIRVKSYIKIKHNKVALNRENIYKRDNYTCVYCGETEKRLLTLDHVVPKAKGGPNTWDNLVTACKKCNGEKSDLTLEEYGKDIPIPKRPHYLMLMKQLNYIPEEWRMYLFLD